MTGRIASSGDRVLSPSATEPEVSAHSGNAPIARERRLEVGERGYFRVRDEYFPARVVANDIRQCFGPVDEIIVYTKYGWQDVVVRTTGGYDPTGGRSWVSNEQYAEIRELERERAAEDFDRRWPE